MNIHFSLVQEIRLLKYGNIKIMYLSLSLIIRIIESYGKHLKYSITITIDNYSFK